MIYKPPITEDKAQYVPLVVKSKDFLIGYVSALQFIETVVIDTLRENGVDVDLRDLDLCLDSSRFNDILENGQRESNLSKKEIKQYYTKMIQRKKDLMEDNHPDNNANVFSDSFLTVECICGLGIYSFARNKLPEGQFKCGNCGRVIIDYTGHDDYEYEYDGKIRKQEE